MLPEEEGEETDFQTARSPKGESRKLRMNRGLHENNNHLKSVRMLCKLDSLEP